VWLDGDWVIVADLDDAGGRRVAVWLEAFSHGCQGAEGRVQSHIEYVPGMVSVLVAAVPSAAVPDLLSRTSPTGAKSGRSIVDARKPGQQPVVVVGLGGNTYALVDL
jgi:hypothetical protein